MAVKLARLLGVEPELIRRAALLHDIGKVAIAPEILLKPDRLTPMEYTIVQTHVLSGEWICGADAEVAKLVRHHHERWDGTGYPDGLAGDAIPLGSRILSVCDVYDTICKDDRPYAEAQDPKDAMDEIQRHAGGQFDPALVDLFDQIIA